MPDPEITELEEEFQEKLGTRVHIEKKESGGQIKIDYFSTEDLRGILDSINKSINVKNSTDMLENFIAQNAPETVPEAPLDDRSKEEKNGDDAELYNIANFSI